MEDQWRAGTLTDEEFQRAKAKLLGDDSRPPPAPPSTTGAREWAMWLHLSMLAGFVVAGAGFIAPIVIWQIKKEEFPEIDRHGRRATNWLISALIYGFVSGLLVFLVIGIPMLLALAACSVIFPIIAGIKANKGEVWTYPLAIEFFKDDPRA